MVSGPYAVIIYTEAGQGFKVEASSTQAAQLAIAACGKEDEALRSRVLLKDKLMKRRMPSFRNVLYGSRYLLQTE